MWLSEAHQPTRLRCLRGGGGSTRALALEKPVPWSASVLTRLSVRSLARQKELGRWSNCGGVRSVVVNHNAARGGRVYQMSELAELPLLSLLALFCLLHPLERAPELLF